MESYFGQGFLEYDIKGHRLSAIQHDFFDVMNAISKAPAVLLLLALFVLAPHARGVLITAFESGPDVVLTTSGGPLSFAALSPGGMGVFGASAFEPLNPGLAMGDQSLTVTCFTGLTAGPPIGSGGFSISASGLGDPLIVTGPSSILTTVPAVCVPASVALGALLGASSSTFPGTSFASLGMTPGTSTSWSWGGGGPTESITLAVVPEPSTYFAGAFALVIVGWTAYRQRRKQLPV